MNKNIGSFVLSIDFELAWGSFDVDDINKVINKSRLTREKVIPRLVTLFSKYDISATWAIVGHLFLDRCNGVHPDINPSHPWFPDWFSYDPGSNEAESPEWYAKSIVDELKNMQPAQDIGLHGFCHCIWGAPGCNADTCREDLREGISAARRAGVEPKSFVFPRNMVSNLEILGASDITAYRSGLLRPNSNNKLLNKVSHMLCQILSIGPPTSLPYKQGPLVCFPSSYLYLSMDGFRRFIPVKSRVKSAIKGIDAAIQKKEVFHMFFHPINLAYGDSRTEAMLDGLEEIFKYASAKRDKGELDILSMQDITGTYNFKRIIS